MTLFFQVLYILCLYEAQISGERLQDHWSSGFQLVSVHLTVVPFFTQITKLTVVFKSNRKAMNRNWSNQKAYPALKTKREINKYYK